MRTPLTCCLMVLCLLWVFALGVTTTSVAQESTDLVITTRKDSSETVKRRGTIVEWKGIALTLESNGRQKEIDNDTIVEIQTVWSDDYKQGIELLNKGDAKSAIPFLTKAVDREPRPWARRIVRSHLVTAFQILDQPATAAEQFFLILKEDRNTRFLPNAPLPWTGSGTGLIQQARTWINSDDSTAKLIGASWLIGSPDRDKAIATLEELSQDIEPRIKSLAIAQLWRTRTRITDKQTAVWKSLVDNMPRELRAGPYFTLAEAQFRAGLVDPAILNLMRVRILYPEQQTLSAAALFRAATMLNNQGKSREAQTLLNELVTAYPQTLWAIQAKQ